jgi:cyclase
LVIGHEKMKAEILAMPPTRLAGLRATYQDFRVALPHITYRDKMSLELGGRQFELYHLENSHTQGDTAIWLPREGILFSGSTLYTSRAPNIRDGSTTGMLKGIDFLATLNPKVVIPGHGPLGEAKDIQQMKQYLSLLRQRVGEEIKKGKKLDEIKTSVKLPEFSHWDRAAQTLPENIESAYFDLTGLPKPKHEAHEEMHRIAGIVEKNEGGGRSITVKAASGESVTLSVSQSQTAITRAGKPAKREEIKAGEKIDAEYNAAEKNMAATIKIE